MKKLLAVVALTATSVFAGTITDPSIPPGSISAPGSFDFAAFDPSLGTLIGISVNIGTSATGTINIFDPTGGSLNFTSATLLVPFQITYTGGSPFTFNATASTSAGGTVASLGLDSITGLTGTGSTTLTISPLTLGYIGGPGSFTPTFSLATSGSASVTGVGDQGLLYGGSGNGTVTASITYTYTSPSNTPEPGTLTLLGSALLSAGFFARKRTKRA